MLFVAGNVAASLTRYFPNCGSLERYASAIEIYIRSKLLYWQQYNDWPYARTRLWPRNRWRNSPELFARHFAQDENLNKSSAGIFLPILEYTRIIKMRNLILDRLMHAAEMPLATKNGLIPCSIWRKSNSFSCFRHSTTLATYFAT